MAGATSALLLKFGYDPAELQKGLLQSAGDVTRNMATIAAAAAAASKALRTETVSAAADGAKSLSSYILTWNNLKVASQVAGEAMKVGFALHHPVLATGMQLLGNYKYALGAVAAGALTAVEAVKWMTDQIGAANVAIAGAEKAGVSTTLFQVWRDQADKARLSAQEMTQALEHATQVIRPTFTTGGEQNINNLTRYSDELQNGRGFATESYQAIKEAGYDMDKWHVAAALVVTDYQKAATALGDASLAAKAVQIATENWGPNGAKIAAALASGELNIRNIADKARELGTVFSEQVLRAQRESNDALAQASAHLSREMHPAMEGLVRIGIALQNVWTGIVDLLAKAAHMMNIISGNNVPADLGKKYPDLAPTMGNVIGLRQRAYDGPGVPADVPLPPRRKSLTEIATPSPHVAAAKDATEAKSAVDQYIESLEKANAVAQAELDTIGKSNIERAKSVDLARAEDAAKRDDATLTDAQRAKVTALAEAEGRLKDQTEQTNKAIADRKAMGDYFGNMGEGAVEKLIVDHKNLRDILGDIVKELERAALKWALLGTGFGQSGGGGGLLGSLLGGGKGGGVSGLSGLLGLLGGGGSGKEMNWLADLVGFNPFAYDVGGMVGRGGRAMGFVPASAFINAPRFADGGGIPAIVHAGEIILNQAQQGRVAGAMGGKPTINQHFHLTGTIAGSDVEMMVRQGAAAAVAQYDSTITSRLADKQARSF